MFSKKTMDVFREQKNIGFLKDADAVGKVGNPSCGDIMWVYIKVGKNEKGEEVITDVKAKTFGCLPGKEKVVLGGNWQSIESIKENQRVVNGKGFEAPVKKLLEIPYRGKMLKFTPLVSSYNSFSATPEHPILALQRKEVALGKTKGGKSKWLRVNKKKLIQAKPKYVNAGKLKEGDYLIFTSSIEVKDNQKMSNELLRLLGYYLAEGYPIARGNAIAFAFHKNEKQLMGEVKQIVKGILGKEMGERTRGNATEIYFCSKKLADKLINLGGKGARNKSVSEEVLKLPPKKQMRLIDAFWAGDGDITTRRKGDYPTYRLATASQKLALQFQEILARNSIFSAISKRERKSHKIEGRDVTGSALYLVKYKKDRKHEFVHKLEDYFLVPIKRITKTDYKGFVYNIHMKNKPNSYLVKGFVVHNCVAAIATASAVGDMAKGKTLEEAEKISMQGIAQALNGLPPEKMHCSALAQKGLKAAIEEYKNQKKQ